VRDPTSEATAVAVKRSRSDDRNDLGQSSATGPVRRLDTQSPFRPVPETPGDRPVTAAVGVVRIDTGHGL